MTALLRTAGDSGALFDVSGTIPTGATWSEDIYFTEAGAPFDLTGLDFRITLRSTPDLTAATLTLSITNGNLALATDSNGYTRILRINVPADTLTSYSGDYIIDIASKDAANTVVLWGHGVMTLHPNPVSFS